MPCYNPQHAWYSWGDPSPQTGKRAIVFDHNKGDPDTHMLLPCGNCIGCTTARANSWALRCYHESKLHASNYFVTLTYADTHPHCTGSLVHSDIQTFLKNLRYHILPNKIRYFHCGEYGGKNGRPHHHLLIFGLSLPDLYIWMPRDDYNIYRSSILEKLWPHGFATVGILTQKTCFYVTKYQTKDLTSYKQLVTTDLARPYFSMSRYPGLGINYFWRYYEEILTADGCHIGDGIFFPIPRYYLKQLEKEHPHAYYNYVRTRNLDEDTLRLVRDDAVGAQATFDRIASVRKRVQTNKQRPLEYY